MLTKLHLPLPHMIEDVHNVCTRNGKTQKGNIIWSVNNPLLHGRVTNALKNFLFFPVHVRQGRADTLLQILFHVRNRFFHPDQEDSSRDQYYKTDFAITQLP